MSTFEVKYDNVANMVLCGLMRLSLDPKLISKMQFGFNNNLFFYYNIMNIKLAGVDSRYK